MFRAASEEGDVSTPQSPSKPYDPAPVPLVVDETPGDRRDDVAGAPPDPPSAEGFRSVLDPL